MENGQMADPGRKHQEEAEQTPSGQTGVQVGRIDGQPVASGVPQQGDEPETTLSQAKEEDDARKRTR